MCAHDTQLTMSDANVCMSCGDLLPRDDGQSVRVDLPASPASYTHHDHVVRATFTKLRSGRWGLKVAGKQHPGTAVLVTKKSGRTTYMTTGRVVWDGTAQGADYTITEIA